MMNGNWDIAEAPGRGRRRREPVGHERQLAAACGQFAAMNLAGGRNLLDQDKPNKASGGDVIKMLPDRGANPNQQLYWGGGFSSAADRGE